jgi:hypothetical protein
MFNHKKAKSVSAKPVTPPTPTSNASPAETVSTEPLPVPNPQKQSQHEPDVLIAGEDPNDFKQQFNVTTAPPVEKREPPPPPPAPKSSVKTIREFIILIRSSKGTLHPVQDKRGGLGATAVWESYEKAEEDMRYIPDCSKFQTYILEVKK